MSKADPVALQRLLEDSGVTYRQTRRSYVFACPRCGKKDKLMMFKSDGRFVCWVCAETSGFKGRPEFALVELLNMSMKEVRKRLYGDRFTETQADFFNVTLFDFFGEDEVPPEDLQEDVKGIAWPLDFFPVDHQHGRHGREYLESRGVTLEVAKRFDLRYCPVQRRVIFPVKIGQKLVGWQARATFPTEWEDPDTGMTKKAPKILTTGPRDRVLMFQDSLAGSDHAVICEGPIDALKCHLAGGQVATMGKVVSEQQIKIIKGSGVRKIYLGLDMDAATETMKLLKHYNDYWNVETGERFEIYRLTPAPGYEDLGAMPPELVLERFASAHRLSGSELFLNFS